MTRSDAELLNLQFHRQTVPPVWSSGEGVWLINEDGDRYLDASGGPMVVNIGHGRSEVADTAHKQISTLSYAMPGYAIESRLELKLLHIFRKAISHIRTPLLECFVAIIGLYSTP